MRKCKVYLKGAYGPGNLGDDVLMIGIINVLKESFRPEDIVVGVENTELARLFDPQINWQHYKIPYQAEYLVYGGGGQFFSFKGKDSQSADSTDHSVLHKLKNFIVNNQNPIHACNRLIASRKGAMENLVLSKNVASYCIGLGPFEVEGKGGERLKKFIKNVDFCSVRDDTSAEHYLNFNGDKDKLHTFKDPSFYSEDWYQDLNSGNTASRDYISYILRGWPYSGHGQDLIQAMTKHALKMQEKGHKVRFVSLFREKDLDIIEQFPNAEWLIYDVEKHSISGFMEDLLNSSKYICSARAHGVWLPTILGFPVLAVGIENKLNEVHKGLSKCSAITVSADLDCFDNDFNDYCERYGVLESNIQEQVFSNREQALLARKSFNKWIKETNAN